MSLAKSQRGMLHDVQHDKLCFGKLLYYLTTVSIVNSQIRLQHLAARRLAQSAQCLLLDLSYTLTRKAILIAYLLECHLSGTDTIESLQYLLLASAER